MTSTHEKRKAFVNQEVAIQLKGRTGISRRYITKVYRKSWKLAKKKYP